MSDLDSDVTYWSQEDILRGTEESERVVSTTNTEKIDAAFLTKVRDEIWLHMHKKQFMNKSKAGQYLGKLRALAGSQDSEYLTVAKSIRFLEKIVASLEVMEAFTLENSPQIVGSPSQFSFGGNIASSECLNNPRTTPKFPCTASVNFDGNSAKSFTFPESLLTNRNFLSQCDSGISEVGPVAKKSRTSFGSVNKYGDAELVKRKHDFSVLVIESDENQMIDDQNNEKTNDDSSSASQNNQNNQDNQKNLVSSEDDDEFGNIDSLMKMKTDLEETIDRNFVTLFKKEIEEFEREKQKEKQSKLVLKTNKNKEVNPFFFCDQQVDDVEDLEADMAEEEYDLKGLALYYEREFSKLGLDDDDV